MLRFGANYKHCIHNRIDYRLKSLRQLGVVFLVVITTLLGCSNSNRDEGRDSQILFDVNGVERTVYDFERSYTEHLLSTGRTDSRSERYTHLNKMIDDVLLSQSARAKGFLNHSTYKAAIEYQERKSTLDTYFIDQMEMEIDPLTEEEIQLAYAKRQRKVFVRQLYSQNQVKIDSAWNSLERGESFLDVANRFYQTPSYDSSAGYIGPLSYFGADDYVAEAAFSIPQGAYSKPVRSRLGYHILYIERIEFPAILTEDDYQYRKEGVKSQLRLRRQRMISSDYVYDLLSQLDVETNRENLLLLRDVILNDSNEELILREPSSESAQNIWTDERLRRLAGQLDPNLELATYVLDGSSEVFTFEEYLNWLPFLSFQESKQRLGASVGRGLRNEVLYQKALSNDYEKDERVKKSVQLRGTEILSDLLQYDLTMNALQDTSKVEVPMSFQSRFIDSKNITLEAQYWKIDVETFQESQEVLSRIEENESPEGFEGFSMTNLGKLEASDNDYNLVKQSVLNTPTISYSSDQGWYILNVERRNIQQSSTTSKAPNLSQSYKVYKAIRNEVDSLRNNADIQIDETLFKEIYNLWSPQN